MTTGLILGSGAFELGQHWKPCGETAKRYGNPSMAPVETRLAGHRVVAISRHGRPARIAPHAVNYRANLFALAEQGVKRIVAINTVGGIARDAAAGKLLVADQIIDYTHGRIQTFSDDQAVRHIEFSQPYDEDLRTALLKAGQLENLDVVASGVMAVTQGPRLETAAEIARMAADGCGIVGMTGMPEAVLARELEIPFASLCAVVNPAAGIAGSQIDMASIEAVSRDVLADAARLLTRLVSEVF